MQILHTMTSLTASAVIYIYIWRLINIYMIITGSDWLQKRKEEMERLEKEKWAEIRSYKGLMVAEKMTSNRQIASAGKSMQEMEDEFV